MSDRITSFPTSRPRTTSTLSADMRPSVWGEVIRPMLADRQGWATFIGTPKGRNEFFAIYQKAVESADWYAAMLKASETGILAEDELQDARATMTPGAYEQEFECSFEAAIVGAYYGSDMAAADRDGRIGDHDYDPALPVHCAWDLGIGDSTAIPVLAEAPAARDEAERKTARSALVELRHPTIAAALVAHLAKANPAVQSELIGALTARNE